jgi:hypothetical protein
MLEWLKTILGEAYTDEIDRAVSAEITKNYAPASEVTRLNGEIKRLGTEHPNALNAAKLGYMLDARLTKEGAVNLKAVKALLDNEKIKLDGESLTGLDDQLNALKTSDPWAFKTPEPPKPQEQPPVPGAGGNPPPTPINKSPLPTGTVIF